MLVEFIGGDFSAYGELVSPPFPPMPAYNSDPHSPLYKTCRVSRIVSSTDGSARFKEHVEVDVGESDVCEVNQSNATVRAACFFCRAVWLNFGCVNL